MRLTLSLGALMLVLVAVVFVVVNQADVSADDPQREGGYCLDAERSTYYEDGNLIQDVWVRKYDTATGGTYLTCDRIVTPPTPPEPPTIPLGTPCGIAEGTDGNLSVMRVVRFWDDRTQQEAVACGTGGTTSRTARLSPDTPDRDVSIKIGPDTPKNRERAERLAFPSPTPIPSPKPPPTTPPLPHNPYRDTDRPWPPCKVYHSHQNAFTYSSSRGGCWDAEQAYDSGHDPETEGFDPKLDYEGKILAAHFHRTECRQVFVREVDTGLTSGVNDKGTPIPVTYSEYKTVCKSDLEWHNIYAHSH